MPWKPMSIPQGKVREYFKKEISAAKVLLSCANLCKKYNIVVQSYERYLLQLSSCLLVCEVVCQLEEANTAPLVSILLQMNI